MIKGATNYSQIKDTPEEEAEKLKVFALLRLERYVNGKTYFSVVFSKIFVVIQILYKTIKI